MDANGPFPIEWRWSFDLRVPVADLWPLVMDTSRFNRAMGTARMHFEELDGVRHGWSMNLGMRQEWVERPWTWIARRTLTSVRDYRQGLGHLSRATYVLEPRETGSRFGVTFGWIPRGLLGRVVLPMAGTRMETGFRQVLGEIEAHHASAAGGSPYRAVAPELSEGARSRLGVIGQELHQALHGRVRSDPAARLLEHVATADDMDVHRLRVPALARAWGLNPEDLLLACLHATRLGLLNLSWDVICPHCRGVREACGSLGQIRARGSCAVCAIEFDNDSERSIEVTFQVHPSIREVPELQFCSAEPATKKHIELQQEVDPGVRLVCATALEPGLYRRRLRGSMEYQTLEVAVDGPAEGEWRAGAAGPLVVGPGATLALVNPEGETHTFVVEDARWADDALRPAELFSLQEFRDLFARESLGADVKLSVGEQTLFFTDMVGLTRFYEAQGDPSAFAEVRRHFAEVFEEVRLARGAVVKTIGDAVMAAFSDPLQALRAAALVQRRFGPTRDDTRVRLRISLNRGPCIAVNLNSGIDYFGRTVNAAAKLQALAGGGQIVFPRTLLEAPGVAAYLQEERAELEDLELRNDAFDRPLLVHRWNVWVAPT